MPSQAAPLFAIRLKCGFCSKCVQCALQIFRTDSNGKEYKACVSVRSAVKVIASGGTRNCIDPGFRQHCVLCV